MDGGKHLDLWQNAHANFDDNPSMLQCLGTLGGTLGTCKCQEMPHAWWASDSFSPSNCERCHTNHTSYGYGSIPINTIFRGMNIHKSQLFWCELQGYKVLTHCHIVTLVVLPSVKSPSFTPHLVISTSHLCLATPRRGSLQEMGFMGIHTRIGFRYRKISWFHPENDHVLWAKMCSYAPDRLIASGICWTFSRRKSWKTCSCGAPMSPLLGANDVESWTTEQPFFLSSYCKKVSLGATL